MPIYEYKGQQYELSTDDPAQAKSKILDYLSKQTPAAAPKVEEATPTPPPSSPMGEDFGTAILNAQADESYKGRKRGESVFDWATRTGEFKKTPTTPPEPFDPAMGEFLSRKENVEKLEEAKRLGEAKARKIGAPQATETPEGVLEAQALRADPGATGLDATINFLKRGGKQGLMGLEQGYRGTNQFIYDAFDLDSRVNRQRLGEMRAFSANMGENPNKPLQVMENAIASISQQLPALIPGTLTGSEGLILGSMYMQSFGQNYVDGRTQGLDFADATSRAAVNAAFEVVGEKFGLGNQLKAIKSAMKGKPLDEVIDFYAKALAKEIPGEELTYAGQFGTDKFYGLNPEAGIKQFLEGAVDTALVTVAQSGTMMAGTTAAGKGLKTAAQAKQMLDARLQARDEGRYKQDKSYEGLSEAIARAHGFLTPSQQIKTERAPAETPLGPVGEARPGVEETVFTPEALAGVPDDYKRQQRAAQIEARAQELSIGMGIPEGDARRMAEAEVAAAEEKASKKAPKTEAPADRVEQLTQDYIDAGVAPDVAVQRAIQQVAQEAESDQAAEAVPARPVEPTGGVGVPVAERPTAKPAAAGVGRTEPSGVVSTDQDAGKLAGREGKQPSALTFTTEKGSVYEVTPDGKTVRTKKSPGKGQGETYAPHTALYVKPGDHTEILSDMQGGMGQNSVRLGFVKGNTFNPIQDVSEVPEGTQPVVGVFNKQTNKAVGLYPAETAPAEGLHPVEKLYSPDGTSSTHVGNKIVSITPTAKRGRPVALTEEQRKQKREEAKPAQAAKARADRALQKATAMLDEASKPLDENSFETDEALVEAQRTQAGKKREAIKSLLQMAGDPNLRGTKVAERIKEALKHPSITTKERADVQAGIDATKKMGGASPSKVSRDAVDTRFSKFTNASQALSHIIKNGTPFQKTLGKRIRSFVQGVKFVVIEEGQPLPETLKKPRNAASWDRAIALYVENYKTGERTVFVRGASFGNAQGLNNTTILHELLHAATNKKIALVNSMLKKGMVVNSTLARAYNDLIRTMNSAGALFNDLARAGKLPKEISVLASSGEIFDDPREFVAYGMTDPAMQEFLMQARGFEEDTPFFTRFVNALRAMFGMGEDDVNALSDLIVVTDKILSTRAPNLTMLDEQVSRMFGFGKGKETETEIKIEGEKRRAAPSADVERLAKMLGSKLYGTPQDIATVSVKELFQNSFDAIKGAIEGGQLKEGKIDIKLDSKKRTILITDNGLGMPAEVMGDQFLKIAGTVKETKRASGGLGVAKMLFLFENEKLEVVSLRNGVVARMVTTGEDLKAALSDPSRGPEIEITSDPKVVATFKKNLFPDGHGTAVTVQIPESYVDSSSGETKKIRFDLWDIKHSNVLEYSPLFTDVKVTLDEDTLDLGSNFPVKEFTPFANVKFAWGTARIYASKNTKDYQYSGNTHILSNGLWQFSKDLKDRPGYDGKQIRRTFYVDVSPNENVKPEDAGYPFDLNRQRFSAVADKDFQNIFNYITALYSQVDLASSVKNFGTVQYVNADGSITTPEKLEPKAPPSDNAFTLLKPGDDVEVRDGVLYVNNRAVPELTTDDLKNTNVRIDELTIPQGEIDPNKVMIHDNTVFTSFDYEDLEKLGWNVRVDKDQNWVASKDGKVYTAQTTKELIAKMVEEGAVQIPSISDRAREKFGSKYDKYLAKIGDVFKLLRTALVASDPSKYADLTKEAVGVSIDNEYYGVSIRVPFHGSFINPTTTKRANTPEEVSISMIGTMIHELAHFEERNHGAAFASEMQDIMIALRTSPGFDLLKTEAGLTAFIKDNWDVFQFLHREFRSGNYKPRGNRFSDSAEEIPDAGTAGAMEGKRRAGENGPLLSRISESGIESAGQINVSAADDSEDEAATEAVRSQKEVDAAVKEAEKKFEFSKRAEEYAKAATLLQAAQDPAKIIPYLNHLWNRASNGVRAGLVKIPSTDFLVSWAANPVPELQHTNKLLQEMSGTTEQLLRAAGILLKDISRVYRANPGLEAKINKITNMATLAEVDPSDPKAKVRNAKLDLLYSQLGPDGRRIFQDTKKYFESLSNYFSQLLDDQISKSDLGIAEKANLMKKVRALYETGAKINPYFPLVRRGDYWLSVGSGKNKAFMMFDTAAERDEAMQGLADERIGRGGAESNEAWEKRRAENLQTLLEDQTFNIGNDISSLRSATFDSSSMMREIFDSIDAMFAGHTLKEGETDPFKEAKENLKDSVYQIYLQTMPEQSFRRQFIHRKGYAGFSTDFFRNVATTSSKMAMQLARIKYAPDLRNSLSQARDSIANRPKYEPFVKEMEKRVAQELSSRAPSTGEKIAGSLNKASFIWYLGAASSALLQPLSVFQTGLPVLAAKYGHIGANRELMKMLKVWSQYGYYVTNRDGSRSWVMPSVEYSKNLTPDERRAVGEMIHRDVSNSSYATDALNYKNTKVNKHTSHPIVKFGSDTVDTLVLGGLMHTTERLSREALYLASYRLNRQAGKTHEQAVDEAVLDTHETLGNYGPYNRPRWMKGFLGKTLTQFMMYPVHVTLFLLKNFKEMIVPMDGHTRWEATQKFFGTLANTFILAGAVGLPMFSVVMGLLGWAWKQFNDDERPNDLRNVDFEFWWRKHWLPKQLGETMIGGKKLSDIVERGPINALTGLDIGGRTSLNNLFFRDTKEYKDIRQNAMAMALERAGPSANMILSWAEAVEAFMLGDYKKGVNKALPSGIRNFVNAYNEATEGVKGTKGEKILTKDAFTTGELIGQAVGFRSDLLANTQYVNFKVIGMEQKIKNERDEITAKLDRAFRDRNMKQFQGYLKEMQKFDAKYPMYRIGEHLADILETRAEQRAKSLRGVELTETRAPMFAEPLLQVRKEAAAKEKAGRGEK